MTQPTTPPAQRPHWRGRLHQWAAVFAVGAGTGVVAMAPTPRARLAVGIYALSLAILFGTSATYHRITWGPRALAWMRRADHAAIFVLIGGTYTPVMLLGVGGEAGARVLSIAWIGVAVGALVSLFWPRAPKALRAAIAIAVGWTAVPYLGAMAASLGAATLSLILLGGVAYSAGAVIYALKRPNPWPRVFGYHEVFHALTIVAAALHLAAVIVIVRGHAVAG
jgi:hemolysin III